jgi:hypothetical protein
LRAATGEGEAMKLPEDPAETELWEKEKGMSERPEGAIEWLGRYYTAPDYNLQKPEVIKVLDYITHLEAKLAKAREDSKRVDRFLYLNICMNDEGWHPLSRDEFDTTLDTFEASREEERRLRFEVEEEPNHE